MTYQINGFHKFSQLDNYENGCTGPSFDQYIDHRITAESLQDIKAACERFTGGEMCTDMIEDSRLDFQVMETADGFPATEYELERFKVGEIELYDCTYTVYVATVTPADISELFEEV